MDISIVIPAYDESKKIELDIEAASAFIKNNNMKGEIIVVDDGSKDNTASVAQRSLGEAGLPKEALAGAIIRDDNIIIPPADSVIYPGDHVIIVSPLSATSSVEKMFK